MATSREVIDALLRGKPAERVGLTDSPWTDTLLLWVKEGYPTRTVHKIPGQSRWRPEDGQWEDVEREGEYVEPVPPWMVFHYDMVGTGPWFDVMPLIDYEETIQETEEWKITRNGAGGALKYWKHKMGTPEHIDFRMTSRAVWERDYRPHLLDFDPRRLDLPELRKNFAENRQQPVWVHFGHMFIWELMRQSMGDVTMYESLLDDPAWIHDYNQVYTALYKKAFATIFSEVGMPDGVWLYEDMGYKNGLFASPKLLGELIFPYYREMIQFFHSYNLPVVLHSCGSTAQALPLIVEAGFDALNPMERKAKDNDPFVFAEKYGERLAFIGGMDVRVFETNDRDTITREVGDYIDGMKARGARLVFASDHSLPPTIHYDSYRWALDTYREHMLY